jgi:hypothetical protein
MRYRDEAVDDDGVAIMSPSVYFGSGCAGAGVPATAGDSSEQPAEIALRTRKTQNKQMNRGFPAIVLI